MSSLTRSNSTNQLVTAEHQQAIRVALQSSLYPGAADSSVDMVLSYCMAAQLDPMTKPVHIVPIWIKEHTDGSGRKVPGAMRDVVMPGIELYRTKAHRTGEYAGQDDSEFGPTIEAKLSGVAVRYPEWCKVTVYRMASGQRVPYSARVYWLETYATAKRDSDAPNAMWLKRPFGQLEKCAEAQALRKAFPEAVGAQPTAEEMEGKSLDADAAPARPLIEMPKSKLLVVEAEAVGLGGLAKQVPETTSAPGWHISDSQKRLVLAKAKGIGLDEASLLGKYTAIAADNINDVLADLTAMAAAESNG